MSLILVMDLGRKPLARFPSGDWVISEMPVTQQDLKLAVSKVGDFSDDNRSKINRSLHRISAIQIIRDLIEGGRSILVIGSPGVGKTTLIRKRVVIVDTSNEIGGDGDVPHSGIGRARRMQIPNVNLQHDIMIEAVENHMPETIIIDERGVQLVTPIPSETMFLIS
uniref:AAA+ ATPase domain-containing protein n=1 Tax=Brassica oleracea var. oleracea TaxID=109376 RepID=A0A0D3EFA4_BRAOL